MATVLSMATFRVKASYDTLQRISYNPHNAPNKKPDTISPPKHPPTVTLTTSTGATVKTPVDELLRRKKPATPTQGKLEESYMGYDLWLPSAPKVNKPRSVYNAASLAYIGDCIYELYARRHFLFPQLNIEEFNDRVTAVVRCEAQDALLQKLNNDNFLTQEERDILRWGKNVGSAKTKTVKRAGVAVYNRASSLETLVGYLYLTNAQRLEEVMTKLGFSTGDSTQSINVEGKSKLPDASSQI